VSEPTANPNRESPQTEASGRNGPLSLRDRVQGLRLPNRPAPRRSPLALVPWILCAVLLGTTVVLALRQPASVPGDDDAKRASEKAQAQAQAGVAPGDVMLDSKGYIVPIHQIQVSPKVSGTVLSLRTEEGVPIEEGLLVKKGCVLAVLEKVEYQADRDHCKGQVEAARNRWHELHLSLDFLIKQAAADLADAASQYQTEYVQLQSEINSREGTSIVDVQKRKATVEAKMARMEWHKNQVAMIGKGSLAAKVAAAKADLEQYEADLAKAEWRLSNCVVTAPVTGVILTKRAEEGSLVNPSAFSNGLSASLCDMADLSELEVDLSIPERDVARLIAFKLEHKKKQKCQVRADAFPNRVYEGFVSRIMPTADRAKGAVPVRVKIVIPISEAGDYLRPDMSAAVTFLNEETNFVQTLRPLEPALLPDAKESTSK
jgi:multidrug resistance efflux pump